ncbi:hypothetical protein L2E82_49144 [Cichorium intybus]|uniref:Uncharacterized protein n=1 Tax=Cichorium intybus TaxID=13427 RepID=A0ACB8Z0E4_CICIN|nr:hypothetical protein L2E82_49144 [Cichorium intybus]
MAGCIHRKNKQRWRRSRRQRPRVTPMRRRGATEGIDQCEELGLQLDEILINVGLEEPRLWIWVTNEMVHGNLEETSEFETQGDAKEIEQGIG